MHCDAVNKYTNTVIEVTHLMIMEVLLCWFNLRYAVSATCYGLACCASIVAQAVRPSTAKLLHYIGKNTMHAKAAAHS
jgi:hypothetical protein